MNPHITLSNILIYPLKSAGGHQVDEAVVEPWGLAGDRRWAVIDEDGARLHLRDFPLMLSVEARAEPGALLLAARDRPDLPNLKVCVPEGGPEVPVGFHGLDHAVAADAAAGHWFGELLGHPARLVWLDDPTRRSVGAEYGGLPGEVVSFASDTPLLLASKASLRLLDDWIVEEAMRRQETVPEPLDIKRFRPSVVVEGAEPYAEDGWREVRIGPVDFRVTVICDRCVMTTYDPDTREDGKEPLRSLSRHRRWDGKTWFGIRLVPRGTGTLRVGDPVTVLR
jgi:uncharacterized protein YcbX